MTQPFASQGDLQVVLPNVSGLEFWTSQNGGDQLTPDANGDLVDVTMPDSGQYSNTFWVDSPIDNGVQASGAFGSAANGQQLVQATVKKANTGAAVTTFSFAKGQFGGDVTVYKAGSFTDTNGKKWLATDTPPHVTGGNSEFIVLDATNLTDTKDAQHPTDHICWVQFFYFTVNFTETPKGGGTPITQQVNCTVSSPDGTKSYPSTTDLTKIKWCLDNGGTNNNANYDFRGISKKTAYSLGIADIPSTTSGQEAHELVLNPPAKSLDPSKDTISSVQITFNFESYLMCGGTSLAQVTWTNAIDYNYVAELATYHKLVHSGVSVADATNQAIEATSSPTYTLNAPAAGTPNKDELALLNGNKLTYPK